MAEEFQLFTRWEEFLKWLLTMTEKFPKKVRFTFTSRIDNLALDIFEQIIECRYDRSARQAGLKRMNIGFEKMRILIRICHQLRYLSNRQYEYAAIHINEAGRMTAGWLEGERSR